ncbi:serine/threonine-protein kinase PknD [Nematostella vectensis]|uniref:serine/threonine-protein kinase PknD n=1 Tax=Nematostella vectensis TaxID=45351 RepID=UPI002077695F|nr:serine/threonine-protein kinase PknD [Nematostella vectensis]
MAAWVGVFNVIVFLLCRISSGPAQEIPLADTFINPTFQVAQYLWEGKSTRIVKELEKVLKPSYILATPQHSLFISSFMIDQVLYVVDTRQSNSPAVTFASGHGLDGPWGMVADNSTLFVASFTTDRIHKYDISSGRFLGAFGSEQHLDCPEGMALGPNHTLYVASFLNDRVVKYSLGGQFLGVVADASSGLKGPEDVAFLPDGTLLICSHYTNNVLKLNTSTNKLIGVFAEVQKPVGLTVGLDGNVYVTSYVTNSILRYSGKTGKFIDVYAAGGGLTGPSSVSFADFRTLYAASYDSDRVMLYNSTSGLTFTLPGRLREQVGEGSFAREPEKS